MSGADEAQDNVLYIATHSEGKSACAKVQYVQCTFLATLPVVWNKFTVLDTVDLSTHNFELCQNMYTPEPLSAIPSAT